MKFFETYFWKHLIYWFSIFFFQNQNFQNFQKFWIFRFFSQFSFFNFFKNMFGKYVWKLTREKHWQKSFGLAFFVRKDFHPKAKVAACAVLSKTSKTLPTEQNSQNGSPKNRRWLIIEHSLPTFIVVYEFRYHCNPKL